VLFPHEAILSPINHSSWEYSAVIVDVLFSLASIGILYGMGKKLHSTAAGLWAAFFLAVQPFGVTYAINGLTEPTYVFFLLTSLYFVLLARSSCKFDFFLIGMWVLLPLLVRKDGIVLPAIIGTYIFALKDMKFSGKIRTFFTFLSGIGLATGIYLLIGGRFNWIGHFVFALDWNAILQKITLGLAGNTTAILATTWNPHWVEIVYLPLTGWFKLAGFFPAILFIVYLFQPSRFCPSRRAWLFIFAFLFQLALVYAFTIGFDLLATRYLYPATVVLFPIAGAVLTQLLGEIRIKIKRENSLVPSIVVGGIIFITLVSCLLVSCFHLRHPEIRSAANWLASNTPRDSIAMVTDNRIGFYSERKDVFVSEHFYNDVLTATFKSQEIDRCYLAVFIDKKEAQTIHDRLAETAKNFKFEPVLVKKTMASKKEVEIYKLRSLPPPTTSSQPNR
jgi:hypothetical protein